MKTKNNLILITMIVFIVQFIGSCSEKKQTEPDILEVGDIIQFGIYPWRVLDIQTDKALVLSENIFRLRQFHTSQVNITWAECNLRSYLNEEFYNSNAFSDADRARIIQVTNDNKLNQWFGTWSGIDTQDRIFLLSIDEVVQYFGDSGQLENKPLETNNINDSFNSNRIATFNGAATRWWLRSNGMYNSLSSNVDRGGRISMSGHNVVDKDVGVRPALWLQM